MKKSNKRLKKIYLEVTNACNLSCDFCIKNKRKIEYLSFENFKLILDKIIEYTDYLYFHVLGEPLMHPSINEFINYASNYLNVQITTNGYLINKIAENKNIRQINISLHSYDERYNISLEEYMNNIFKTIDKLIENKTYISLRLWVKNKHQDKMINMINNHYACNIDLSNPSFKINKYLYIKQFHEFIWPDLNNNYCSEIGTCYALRDHIGILTDGTVIPCCLDTKGDINLGNIYHDQLKTILSSKRVKEMLDGFRENKKREQLCKHCSFINTKQ